MKQYFYLALVAVSFSITACNKAPELKTYTLNDFTVGIPADFIKDKDSDSTSLLYASKDYSVLVDATFDTREGFEKSLAEDGKAGKYPFTLKGSSDCSIDQFKDMDGYKEISRKETQINQLPAIVYDVQFNSVDSASKKVTPKFATFADIDGQNGKLYGVFIISAGSKAAYADSILYSFKLTK